MTLLCRNSLWIKTFHPKGNFVKTWKINSSQVSGSPWNQIHKVYFSSSYISNKDSWEEILQPSRELRVPTFMNHHPCWGGLQWFGALKVIYVPVSNHSSTLLYVITINSLVYHTGLQWSDIVTLVCHWFSVWGKKVFVQSFQGVCHTTDPNPLWTILGCHSGKDRPWKASLTIL